MKKLISTILCAALLAPAGIPAAADGGTDAVAAESGLTAGMEVTYNYPILTDPMQMSDEELFGAWSTAEEGWMVEPKFAYSEWPAMQAVEEAAKAGDYAAAKDALLEYYRTECSDRISQVYTHPGERALEQSLALARNFYGVNYGSNVIRKLFEVDNTMKERHIDVTSSIASAAGSEQYRSFVIASVDQETTAEFLTKEGGFTSVLSMNVNGAPMELRAEADTYISAGGNDGQAYGAEPVMLASEGVTTQYISSTEDTKRCLIKFDVSGLSATDEINSATLIVKGRNASGTGIKELVLYQWADSGFSEDTVCWSTFAEHYMFSCNAQDCWDYVTSNSTLIKGKSCFYHRGNELQIPANLYSYTGDEAYAYTFIRQQMGLIHSIGYNPAVMNELDMSTHLDNTLLSVFRVLPSEHMTGERFAAMFKHLWLIARWICEEYYGTRSNNYATFGTLGGYSFISHFREITDYDQWLLNTQNENDRVQGTFVREDGTSIELARGYQGTLLSTLSSPISRQRSTQNPDFPFTQYAIDNIRRLLHDFVYSASPGWKGFNLGDGNDAYTDYSSTYTFFYNNLLPDDQLLAYVVSGGTEGTPPEQTSMSFPYGLRTYLRSDWGDTADSLVFTAKGELNSSHGDSDLLSVAMFAHGQYLLIDPGYGSVLTGDIFRYMGSAQQHNTVTVNGQDHTNDGRGHAAAEGREEEVELNDIYDFVTYSADDALSTAEQFRRSVAFVRDAGFWIVSDYIRQDGTAYNDYSQQWHMLPDANIQIDPDTKIAYSSFEGVNVQVVPVSPEDYTYVQLEETMYSPSSGSFVR